MAGIGTLGYLAIASAVAGSGASVYSSAKSASASEDQLKQQKSQNDATLQKANDDQTNQITSQNANAQRDSQRAMLAAQGLGNQGRQGTILTSPLGVVGNTPAVANKTVLGA